MDIKLQLQVIDSRIRNLSNLINSNSKERIPVKSELSKLDKHNLIKIIIGLVSGNEHTSRRLVQTQYELKTTLIRQRKMLLENYVLKQSKNTRNFKHNDFKSFIRRD